MDWFKNLPKSTRAVIISIAIALLALLGINATFTVEESESPAVMETSNDIVVGEITITLPEN